MLFASATDQMTQIVINICGGAGGNPPSSIANVVNVTLNLHLFSFYFVTRKWKESDLEEFEDPPLRHRQGSAPRNQHIHNHPASIISRIYTSVTEAPTPGGKQTAHSKKRRVRVWEAVRCGRGVTAHSWRKLEAERHTHTGWVEREREGGRQNSTHLNFIHNSLLREWLAEGSWW